MRNPFPIPLILGALVALAPASLHGQAQEVTKGDMLKTLYAKLAHLVSGGDPKSDSLLLLSCPGFSIPNQGLATDPDMVFLAQTLNAIPQPNPLYTKSGRTYTDVYGKLINGATLVKTPLTPEEAGELKALIELTQKKNPRMTAYMDHKKAFDRAQAAVNTAVNQMDRSRGGRVDSTLLSAVQDAKRAWLSDGFKLEIERAFVRLQELSNKDGALYWKELQDNYAAMKSLMTAGVPAVDTYPPPSNWGIKDRDGAATSSWTTFTWKSSEKSLSSGFSSKELEAAASYSSGAVSISASGGFSKVAQDASAGDTSMEISVDLMRVGVYRPWLEMSIFDMANWKYPQAISGGDPANPVGEMPLMINEIWIAKNLKVSGEWARKFAKARKEHIHAETDASFGPFSLSAKYAQTDNSSASGDTKDEESIRNPDIQVIGFVCSLVPKAPKTQP